MNWVEINSEKDLPKEGKYVIAKHNKGTWHDDDDQENVNTVIVKLVRGISEEEREEIRGTKKDLLEGNILRSDIYKQGDEHWNNAVPWAWETFGSDTFFGQEITHWTEISPLS